jgi:hypothetical protein
MAGPVTVDVRAWGGKDNPRIRIKLIGTKPPQEDETPADDAFGPEPTTETLSFDSVEKQVVSFAMQKSLSQPCGVFTAELIPHGFPDDPEQPVYDQIHPLRQLAVVHIDDDPQPVMVGFVDIVNDTGNVSGESGQRRIRIQGRDLGALCLLDQILFLHNGHVVASTGTPVDADDSAVPPQSIRNKRLVSISDNWGESITFRSPKEVISFAITFLLSLDITLANGATLERFFDYWSYLKDEGDKVSPSNLRAFQGSLWNFLKKCIDSVVYEMWCESGLANREDRQPFPEANLNELTRGVGFTTSPIFGGLPVDDVAFHRRMNASGTSGDGPMGFLRLRPLPFLKEYWDSTLTWCTGEPYHHVRRSDIKEWSLGRSHLNSFSLFWTTPHNYGSGAVGNMAFQPTLDYRLLGMFGLRPLHAHISLMPLDPDKFQDVFAEGNLSYATQWNKRFSGIYSNNHRRETGNIVVKGNTIYRCGDRVRVERQGVEDRLYYIEGVQHQWTFGGPFVSSLTLTRGEPLR